ncbi:MAG: hypothetical protein LBG52_09090 [Candidatus Peribacteria bacterium]|nr:hypothetical protein [Candidatus Peribacteria bacterium]
MHGTGMQTRTVVCKSSDGSTVEDSNCSETKPSTSQYCNTCTTQSSAINGSCGSANQQTYYEN